MPRKRRIICRPGPRSSDKANDCGLAGTRRPKNPFARGLRAERSRQSERQHRSMFQSERRDRFLVFAFAECLRLHNHIFVTPNNEVSAVLGHASFLRLSNEIVKSIQRRAQLPICEDAFQTGHRHQKNNAQNRDRDDDLDQRKCPVTLHRRSYAPCAKSQDTGSQATSRRMAFPNCLASWANGSECWPREYELPRQLYEFGWPRFDHHFVDHSRSVRGEETARTCAWPWPGNQGIPKGQGR